MPFCMNCGQRLDEGSKFCDRCGQPQTLQAPAPAVNQAAPLAAAAPAAVFANPSAYAAPIAYANPVGATSSGFSANAQNPAFQAFARKVRKRGWIFGGILAGLALIAILVFVREELMTALLVLAVVVAFSALLSLWSNLKTKRSWEGQLVDKKIVVKREQDHDNDSSITRYRRIPTLYFLTASGKKIKMELGSQQGAFEYYEPGCIVRKHSGFHYPEKRDKGAETICVYCGRIFDRQLNTCPKCKLITLK